MSKHMYSYIEEIVAANPAKSGKYYVYDIDTFDYMINSPNFAFDNDVDGERDWIIDTWWNWMESIDGKYMYVPTWEVMIKIEAYNDDEYT